MNVPADHLHYVLQLADNALILGHRLSEWCGRGPVLEQDIALTNTALDHIGQARAFYQHAAALYNTVQQSNAAASPSLFNSPALSTVTGPADEDDLAYLRDVWDFKNVLLVEQPNGDWAYTIARSFFYDTFQYYFYLMLQDSTDEAIAAAASKSFKEVAYHRRWSSEWIIRLGDGTEESHARMQRGIEAFWPYTGELFEASAADKTALELGIGADLAALRPQWDTYVNSVFEQAGLAVPPAGAWMHSGGRAGRHSEHLGYILADLQFMQRAYPNMEW